MLFDFRIRNQSAEFAVETKQAARPDTIPEEPQSPPSEQDTRPSSPQRPSSPARSHSPTAKQRPDSPQRPGSLPNSRPQSASGMLLRSSSSPLLVIPPVQLSEKVEQLSREEVM